MQIEIFLFSFSLLIWNIFMMQIAPYTEFGQPATKSKYRHESTLLLLSHLTILLCSAMVHTDNCRILAAFKVLQTDPDYNKCAELQICKCIYLTSIIHHAVNGHQRGTLSTLNTVTCKKYLSTSSFVYIQMLRIAQIIISFAIHFQI